GAHHARRHRADRVRARRLGSRAGRSGLGAGARRDRGLAERAIAVARPGADRDGHRGGATLASAAHEARAGSAARVLARGSEPGPDPRVSRPAALVLTPRPPWPLDDGGRIGLWQMVRTVAQAYATALV